MNLRHRLEENTPRFKDVLILWLLIIVVTYQPFIFHERIVFLELGIYLPSIQALLDGLVPYRDFFQLRGPLEIYLPAWLMQIFGENMTILFIHFYVWTVLTYLFLVLIAKEIFRSRLFVYLAVPTILARTFPYAYYHHWGGMRYTLGLIVMWCMIRLFKKDNPAYLYGAGIGTALALLTSIDIGAACLAGVGISLLAGFVSKTFDTKRFIKHSVSFIIPLIIVLGLYCTYLLVTHSWDAFWDMTLGVLFKMKHVFEDSLLFTYPQNLGEWLLALTPFSENFEHMTPVYCFMFFAIFYYWMYRRGELKAWHPVLIGLLAYTIIVYIAAWRKIENAHFEMALVTEKLFLFMMVERLYFYLRHYRARLLEKKMPSFKTYGIIVLFIILLLTTIGYSIKRYNKRFAGFKYMAHVLTGRDTNKISRLHDKEYQSLALPRAKGIVTEKDMAQEYEILVQKMQELTRPQEPVFLYPELGFYSFLMDRPWVGRFAMPTFAWIDDKWHQELMQDLKRQNPTWVIVPKDMPPEWFDSFYLQLPANQQKYDEVLSYIKENYTMVDSTPLSGIYQKGKK